MLKALVRFFKGSTPLEAYENGRRCARLSIAQAQDKSAEADHLYNLSSGGFNTTQAHREFDRGVNKQLHELGYQAPYQNGQF